jgi:Zn-dependent alcohol dehydrogenase
MCLNGAGVRRLPVPGELYLAGKLKIDELITRRYGIDEANEAFRARAPGRGSDNVVGTD